MTSQVPQTPSQSVRVGTIQGIVVREGTGEPIPDVKIALAGRVLTAQESQNLLNSLGTSLGGLPADALQAVQDAQEARNAPAGPTAVSDGDGRFTLRNVPAGAVTVRAQLEGYFGSATNAAYPSVVRVPVTATADQTSSIRVIMLPGGSVSGRVFDPAGKPLSEAPVQILSSGYSNGAITLELRNLMRTDDRGEYRFYRLPPGEYVVAASPRPLGLPGSRGSSGSNVRESQITTFHPNTAEQTLAQRVALRSGDELTGINIQMRTASAVKVSGRVTSMVLSGPATDLRGQPRVGGVLLVPKDNRGLINLDLAGAVSVGFEGGNFEFQGVTPGTYDVIARLSAARGSGWGPYAAPATATAAWAFGRATVEVRSADVDNVDVVVRSGVDIKSRVLLDGKPTRAHVRITLSPDDVALQSPGDQQIALVMNQIEGFPSSAEGWLREVRKSCEASLPRRRGGVGQDFLTSTTPSAPQRSLRDIFLMSRPPLLG
jgi:hypothetical protein